MKRYVGILWAAFVLMLVAFSAPATGQGTILFRMDESSAAWPNAGFAWTIADLFDVRWSRQRVAGAGPSGQDVVQLTELPGDGQHGWGWHGHIVPDLAQGGTRFFRWRHRVTSASNCAASTSNKLLVVAQGCSGGRCRVIVEPKCNSARMVQYNFKVDGGVYQVETGYIYPVGTWLNIQLEMKTSTTATTTSSGSTDGALKLWVNNNNYSSPTIQNNGIYLNAGQAEGSYIIFGGYNNNGGSGAVPSGATNIQQYADFEVATGFDASWNGGGSTPPPPTAPSSPTNVRVLTSN